MSALPTLIVVMSMLYVVTLAGLTLAHVKLGILEMAKVAMVCLFVCFTESVDVLLCFCFRLYNNLDMYTGHKRRVNRFLYISYNRHGRVLFQLS